MTACAWLSARPIAHRGLHDARAGVIENALSAARAAIAAGYAIECDVQSSRDGEAFVFHDDTLERLTEARGRIEEKSAAELAQIALRGSADHIPSLADFLGVIGGRAPLVIEIKSRFDGDLTLARRVMALLAGYAGPVVVESFDPDPITFLREQRLAVPLGMVAMAAYTQEDWPELPPARRAELTHFLHYSRTRPDFLSWNVADLPHAIPLLCRDGLKLPVTVWTVRAQDQADVAAKWADQIVFEGFAPGLNT